MSFYISCLSFAFESEDYLLDIVPRPDRPSIFETPGSFRESHTQSHSLKCPTP
jgi:hypothetical protein